MKERFSEAMEAVETASRTIVEQYRKVVADDDHDASLSVVQYRGGREELDLGIEYARSADPLDRMVGAEVLSQLGWSDRTFLDESVEALIALLEDTDPSVVEAAAYGLGHRADERAVPHLIRLAGHDSSEIRLGMVYGLTGQEDPETIKTLIRMSSDPDEGVRDWATFGLGTQIETDTPEIREALHVRLSDEDAETRGEALVGLAKRRDPRVVPAILKEWEQHDETGILSIEAAETMGDPVLLPQLEKFLATMEWSEDDSYFKSQLERAIVACRGESGPGLSGSDSCDP